MKRACICGAVLHPGEECARCRRRRDEERAEVEPWRGLYKTKQWLRAQQACLRRDGGQCRAQEYGKRCPETRRVQVHHQTPLRELWRRQAGDLDGFVSAATRVADLVVLCPRHHSRAERALRAARSGR